MTTQAKPTVKQTLKRLGLWMTLVISAIGWMIATAAHGIDARYVKQVAYDSARAHDRERLVIDSVSRDRLIQKVDSANVRLQQIICGRRLDEGCR